MQQLRRNICELNGSNYNCPKFPHEFLFDLLLSLWIFIISQKISVIWQQLKRVPDMY
jgi:hypothetical protein